MPKLQTLIIADKLFKHYTDDHSLLQPKVSYPSGSREIC